MNESVIIVVVHRFAISEDSYRKNTEDRVLVLDVECGSIACIADGTGGVSGGANAADLFLAGVRRAVEDPDFDLTSPQAWAKLVDRLDREIEQARTAGETTGVALAITSTIVVGASSGDSQAWLMSPNGWHELTENQLRKARLGTGHARAQPFTARPHGTLLLATDGLLDFVQLSDVASVLRSDPEDAASALVQLVRTRFRQLPDDVAVIVFKLE